MAVFIRPDRGAVATKNVSAKLIDGVILQQEAGDKYCLSILSTDGSGILDKDGEIIKDGVLKSGQRVNFKLGSIEAKKYHLMLVPNPEIARCAYVGGPILIEPYQTEELDFMVKVERQIDLSLVGHLFRLYIMD